MSFAALLGVVFGFGLFVGSILMTTDNFIAFLNLPSFLMVFGGTLAAAYMSFQARYVTLSLKAIWQMIKKPKANRAGLNSEIMNLIKWAYVVQTKGTVALENEVKSSNLTEPVLRYGAEMVTTGYKPEDVRAMLESAVENQLDRNLVVADILKAMAGSAPAFGMIGTLVGLVVMLQGLGADMSALGAGMAVALLTTLYGVVFARLLFLPAALNLKQKEEITFFRNMLVVEGLVMLAEKKTPRYMQDKLNSFLDPAIHFNIDKQMKR